MKTKEPTGQKKVCQYCQISGYNGSYSQHLKNQHKKEIGTRALVKSLNSEELEQLKQYILKEIKRK